MGRAVVVHGDLVLATHGERCIGLYGEELSIVAEGQGAIGMDHGIHRELEKIEPDMLLIRQQGGEGDGGERLERCGLRGGEVEVDVVVQDIEGVAACDGLLDLVPCGLGELQWSQGLAEIVAAVWMRLCLAEDRSQHQDQSKAVGTKGHGTERHASQRPKLSFCRRHAGSRLGT